jgi:hypothetical protein
VALAAESDLLEWRFAAGEAEGKIHRVDPKNCKLTQKFDWKSL